MENQEKLLLMGKEACRMLGVSMVTFRLAVAKHKIQPVILGAGRKYWRKDDILALTQPQMEGV
jgi:hypothetical protein